MDWPPLPPSEVQSALEHSGWKERQEAGSFVGQGPTHCKGNLFEEKVPGHQVVSLFGGWCPCGLIFDQIHTNEEPDAPGAEGDISGGQA